MDDGKPLVVTVVEKEGSLWLEFIKTREGLWVQSTGAISNAPEGAENTPAPWQRQIF